MVIQKIANTKSLRRKDTRSCGCLAHDILTARNYKHGKAYLPESQMIENAKDRAKRKGLPFNITIKDIFIPKTCPILGIPLFPSKGQPTDNSPELDRFVPSLGYIRGNIEVISRKANRIKTNATTDEVTKVAEFMRRRDARTVNNFRGN